MRYSDPEDCVSCNAALSGALLGSGLSASPCFLLLRRFGGSTVASLFLSLTERRPAEILVVEGWIGRDGVRAAATEFERGVYRYVITSGGVSESEGWTEGGWSYAEGAQQELIRSGVPEAKIIVAPAMDVERQRTYESALAVWRKLQSLSIKPKSINIFTLGPHARRSRLVFAKVEGSETRVGVISWTPSCNQAGPWCGGAAANVPKNC
jgi:uncharacterized SAM-binding protein YcdF (DUF218 family)